MGNVSVSIDERIFMVENTLENIFDKYRDNSIFEELVPVAFIYKNAIRFVPIELKDEVEELLKFLNKLEEEKTIKFSRTFNSK